MAGHSKWANIKHRKARQDAAKGIKERGTLARQWPDTLENQMKGISNG